MRVLFGVVFFQVLCACTFSQVQISGTVLDSATGEPVSGAHVFLEQHRYATTTDQTGSFTLYGEVGIKPTTPLSLSNSSIAYVKNGVLSMKLTESAPITIRTYSLRGALLFKTTVCMSAGLNRFALPATPKGIQIHSITTPHQKIILRNRVLDGKMTGSDVVTRPVAAEPVAAQSKRMFAQEYSDALRINKNGYLTRRIEVTQNSGSIEATLISSDAGSVTDIDGNVYEAVRVGNQIWSVQNLRTTRFRNGDSIPHITSSTPWQSHLSSSWDGAYCFFINSTTEQNREKWGALYSHDAVRSSKQLAPEGWHIATDDDWTVLEEHLTENGYNWDQTFTGNKIGKALAASTEWADDGDYPEGAVGCELELNNASGFSALPSYSRTNSGSFGTDHNVNNYCTWWTATGGALNGAGWVRILTDGQESLTRDYRHRGYGLPVRIVKDAD